MSASLGLGARPRVAVAQAAAVLAGIASCSAALAQAQPAPLPVQAPAPSTLETVQITASRVSTTLRETTESVTLISREQIDATGAATGVDLFRQVPGLQIDQLGGPGGLSSVYIRGSDSNHVLVLIDGVRVNDPTNSRGGGFDMSSLDPSTIERIEVLRGAASAIYGAEAMGGVINIVTRNGLGGSGFTGAANAGVGGQKYGIVGGRVAGGSDTLRFSVGASRRKDGSDAEGGRLDLTQYSAAARWFISPRARIDFDLRHGERGSTSFPDDSGGLRLAEIRTLDHKESHDSTANARGRWAFDAVTLNLGASRHEHVETIDSAGVAPGVRSEFGVPSSVSRADFKRHNVSAGLVFALGGASELAVGAEYQREQGGNHTVYTFFGMPIPVDFDLVRNTRSGFAELKWQALKDLIVRAGVRHDVVDGNGSHTSPTLGLRYELLPLAGSVKASYSEGFKPPSFFALGLPPELGGNPNLRSEHSKGGSIGYEQRMWSGKATAGVALFKTRYTDLVTFDNATNQTVNANQVDIHGAEFEARVQLSDAFSVQAHFTRLFSRIVDSDEPLRQRPGRRGGVQLSWAPTTTSLLSWSTAYAALVFDSSIPTGNLTLPTALRSDLSYRWGFRRGMNLSAALDNVFDKHNESYVGAPAPGRRLRLGFSVEI